MPMWLFTYGQVLGALILSGVCFLLAGLSIVPAYFLYDFVDVAYGRIPALVSLPFCYVVWGVGFCLEVLFFKRFVFFWKAKPGGFPFISWSIVSWAALGYGVVMAHVLFIQHFRGTPMINWWFRALGARIGKRVNIQSIHLSDWDLITIEDDALIGSDVHLACHMVEGGQLVFAPIHIKKGATVGQVCSVLPGTTMGENSILGARSLTTKHMQIPDGAVYAGMPAKLIKFRKEYREQLDGDGDGDGGTDDTKALKAGA